MQNKFVLLEYSEFVKWDKILPLQIIMRGTIGLTSKEEDFTKSLMKKLYDKYIKLILIKGTDEYNRDKKIPDNRRLEIDFKYPILNFASTEHNFHKHKDAKIFNKLKDYSISADKIVFAKEFTQDWVPRTVLSINKIEDLELPIIGKPKDGFSAQGIEKFDTYEDAKKSKLKIDLWQEAKKIKREFRAFIMNGEIIHIAERITNTSDDKSVGKKNPNDKINLVYIDQDLNNFPYLNQIKDIKKDLDKKVKLDFYNIDLMLDEDDKMWVPEINGAPGIGPSMFYSIYKSWLKLAYNTKMSKHTEKELLNIMKSHQESMKKEYPKEYKYSIKPI